jgi:hypothetical protein
MKADATKKIPGEGFKRARPPRGDEAPEERRPTLIKILDVAGLESCHPLFREQQRTQSRARTNLQWHASATMFCSAGIKEIRKLDAI